MNALLARFIRTLRPANSETRDPLAEDAPSPLHRAIRWSLPGAALVSIPFGMMAWAFVSMTFGLSIPSWSRGPILGGIGFFSIISLPASVMAIRCCLAGDEPPSIPLTLVAAFNFVILIAALFVSTFLVLTVLEGYRR